MKFKTSTKVIKIETPNMSDLIQKKNGFNDLIKHRKAIAYLNEIDKYKTKKEGDQ